MPTRVVIRTPDGRAPGQRGLQTRQKLIDATVELLATTSYREIKTIDIARAAKTSPATFYQYFTDMKDIVLETSQLLVKKTNTALNSFEDGSWSSEGLSGATRLVDAVLDGWSDHLPVMRVLTAVAAERDPRFIEAYLAATEPIVRALTAATPNAEDKELVHALVSGLTSVAGHEDAESVQGLSKCQRRRGLARLVHAAVTTADA
ncbi:TetR family transcriptional regulator [Streptomyces sp. NPDC058861]|uniref:TetR family transcriptional regulator n=1 Tax=Streptomyces sp. NPDC058861 TaxID=3346653 RepID=UPI0036800721